jgi:hypothetical protein
VRAGRWSVVASSINRRRHCLLTVCVQCGSVY